jgi:UDP-hydrolysing UDP-N-acetyl-D-glucosamine 2-epimerase
MLLSSDTPEAIGKSVGLGIIGFAQVFASFQPDLLLVLGDRFEMLAAVVAALPFAFPIAHIHGGEVTQGAIDESIRHSITKMSHLHFVATQQYAARVIQMGEEPWRVTVSGAPALDQLATVHYLDLPALEGRLSLALQPAPLLVTYHPVTLEYTETAHQIAALLDALAAIDRPIVFTYPNADTAGRVIIAAIEKFVASQPRARVVPNLGMATYFSLMRHAAAMVGNSSSGIIEAASFGLPVVNVGNRQRGRLHSANVVDVDCSSAEIVSAIHEVTSSTFRESLVDLVNPYGDGNAAARIVHVLGSVELGEQLIQKPFHDLAAAAEWQSS